MGNYVIEMENPTELDLNNLTELMNRIQDETVEYISKLSDELNISENCAADVHYFRTRLRWTQELEDKLIELHRVGNPPKMCDFGSIHADQNITNSL